jgi:hypothetical protein
MTLKIAPFDKKKHIRDSFSCGEESLDPTFRSFLQKKIIKNEDV